MSKKELVYGGGPKIQDIKGSITIDTSDLATAAKQLADNHNVTVSNPTADPETGLATSANQLAAGHTVNPIPATSGGLSRFRDIDLDEAAIAVKASAGQIYAMALFNTTAAPLYLQIFNVAQGSVNVGTTVADEVYVIPGNADSDGAGFTHTFPTGNAFSTAITVACTTTVGGADAPGANACIAMIHFK